MENIFTYLTGLKISSRTGLPGMGPSKKLFFFLLNDSLLPYSAFVWILFGPIPWSCKSYKISFKLKIIITLILYFVVII